MVIGSESCTDARMSLAAWALILCAQTFDGPGPHASASALEQSLPIPSGAVAADLYWPTDTTTPVPIVVVGHGFARNKAALTNWGAHFASYGWVAVVPSFPSPLAPDHAANATRLRELIAYVRATPGPVTAVIDPLKSAVVGHSAGGLSALLAAADDPAISVVVALDPVDANGMAVGRAGAISQAVLVLGAEAAMCNANGSASVIYPALTRAGSWFLRVTGSTHCDGEDPSGGACTAFCGGEDAARRALYRRYATAHLTSWFECAANDYSPGGSGLMADLSSGSVEDFMELPGAPCAAPGPDAGIAPDATLPPDDAGTAGDAADTPDTGVIDDAGTNDDAGGAEDAAIEADAGEAADAAMDEDAGAAGDAGSTAADASIGADSGAGTGGREESGCGCRGASPQAAGGGALWIALLALIGLTRRRL